MILLLIGAAVGFVVGSVTTFVLVRSSSPRGGRANRDFVSVERLNGSLRELDLIRRGGHR